MRLATTMLLLALLPQEQPKDVPKDWAKPELIKHHTKYPNTYRIEFPEKAKFVVLLDSAGKAVIYEAKDWLAEKFIMAGAMTCTGTSTFIRDFTGEIQNINTRKHTWISNKDRPVTVTPDGNLIFVARNERSVQMWSVEKQEAPKAEWDAHSRGMMDLFVWGKQFLVTVAATEVRLWNITKLTEKPKEAGFGNTIRSFALAKPDNRFIALNMGKFVHGLDLTTMKGKDLPEDMEAGGGMMEFAPDGKSLVVVTPAKTATVYQATGEWKELLRISGDAGKATLASLGPNGTHLAWVDPEGTLHITHVASRTEVGKIEMPGWKAGSMTWHPNGEQIYLCAEGGATMRVIGKK